MNTFFISLGTIFFIVVIVGLFKRRKSKVPNSIDSQPQESIEQLSLQQERDAIKDKWCVTNNIPLIRIPYTKLDSLNIEDLRLDTSKYIINPDTKHNG